MVRTNVQKYIKLIYIHSDLLHVSASYVAIRREASRPLPDCCLASVQGLTY